MITVSEALKIMSIVAACHPRTAMRMDDREVALATAAVWADLFNEYRLTFEDVVAGVKKRGARFEVAPEPAEIIRYAREHRQERDAKAGPSAEYQALCESKFVDYDTALARLQAKTGQQALGRGIDA